MVLSPRLRAITIGLSLAVLVACDNAAERAEGHYQRGVVLLEAGDEVKAMLEFKNALQLNEDAIEPRLAVARLLEKSPTPGKAIGNYLKVIELDENHLEARTSVGRLLLGFREPEPASEHINVAALVAPEDEMVRGLLATLAQQEERFEDAASIATDLLADFPGNTMAASVLVSQKIAAEDHIGALALLDDILKDNNEEFVLHIMRLQTLETLGDQAEIGAQLETMWALFPDNDRVAQGRVQWFLNQGDAKSAIEAQRGLAELFPDDPSHALNVVALLGRFEGMEAARTELVALGTSEQHRVEFAQALADFDFQQGNSDAAVTGLDAILGTELTEEEKHAVQTQLANILRSSDQKERALELTLEVLEEDKDNVEALKLRSLAAIDDDRPHDAITDLRRALSTRAQDPSILSLLALAHERNGSVGLAQDRLAFAVQVSDSGVQETLRYADFLTRHGNAKIALSALEDALTRRGEVPELLAGLGQVQVAVSDWTGGLGTVRRLKVIEGNPRAAAFARDLELAVLNGEERFESSIGLLRQMWDESGERTSAMENLVRNYAKTGRTDKAAEFLDGILIDDVANLRANLLRGALHAFEGELDLAEEFYRKVIADHPTAENGYGALASLLAGQGRIEEADDVTQAGIDNAENTGRLLFSKASRLEQKQDYEGAIAIYEQLYAGNKISDVLANNLASLLSEFRDDPESLERAFNIAKRLRASEQPAFQDTYGWILYKRGEYERALPPLKAAAEGARNNVFVQYHLGMVYEKLGQTDLAIAQLTRALDLGQGMSLPVLDEARATLERLKG